MIIVPTPTPIIIPTSSGGGGDLPAPEGNNRLSRVFTTAAAGLMILGGTAAALGIATAFTGMGIDVVTNSWSAARPVMEAGLLGIMGGSVSMIFGMLSYGAAHAADALLKSDKEETPEAAKPVSESMEGPVNGPILPVSGPILPVSGPAVS